MQAAHASPVSGRASHRSAHVRWLLGLCLPLTAYALQLKITRVVTGRVPVTLSNVIGLFGSDLAMQASFAAFGCALLFFVGSRQAGLGLKIVLQSAGILYALLLVAAHGYYMSSGTSLDYPMLAFSVSHAEDTLKVLGSAGSTARVIILVTTLLTMLTLPWLLGRRVFVNAEERASDRVLGLSLGLAAAGTLLAIALNVHSSGGSDLARDPLLNVAITYGTASEDDMAWMERAAKHPRGAKSIEAGPNALKKNVVIILLESTGAWATSIQGEHKTTPFLEELAAKSWRADRMYTVVPHTSKALVATLCGIEPRPGVGVAESLTHTRGIPGTCLPELLRTQGYTTMMMQSATGEFENRHELVRNLGFQGFQSGDEMDAKGLEEANYFGYEDQIVVEPIRQWLKRRPAKQPFLFALLTNTPHHDYKPLTRYGREEYVAEPQRNRYLNSVRYQDFVLREIFAAFEQAGVARDTIFMVLGDHGEGLGQHRRYTHNDMIYEEGMRIPFVIYEPGSARVPTVSPVAFNELDVAPTVLEMLGMNVTEGRYVGRSVFAPAVQRVLYAACYNDFKCLARYEGDLKFVDFFDRQKAELYDVVKDPQEKHDLASERPELMGPAQRDLRSWYGAIRGIYRHVVENATDEFVSRSMPKVQIPRKFSFGEYIDLVGVSSTKRVVEPSGWLNVTYTFYVKKRLPDGYRLFVHGYDGKKRYPWDHVPVQRMLPEEQWEPGQYISDQHRIRVPDGWRTKTLVVRGGFWKKGEGRLKASPAAPDDAPVFIELPMRKR